MGALADSAMLPAWQFPSRSRAQLWRRLPLVEDPADLSSVMDLVTHTVDLAEAPHMYEVFQKKQDGAFKVVFRPGI
jgi:hypothetical protein